MRFLGQGRRSLQSSAASLNLDLWNLRAILDWRVRGACRHRLARIRWRRLPRRIQLEGLSGTGGIRYQFAPEATARGVMPVKAPVFKAPVAEAVSSAGFYVGGYGGLSWAPPIEIRLVAALLLTSAATMSAEMQVIIGRPAGGCSASRATSKRPTSTAAPLAVQSLPFPPHQGLLLPGQCSR